MGDPEEVKKEEIESSHTGDVANLKAEEAPPVAISVEIPKEDKPEEDSEDRDV